MTVLKYRLTVEINIDPPNTHPLTHPLIHQYTTKLIQRTFIIDEFFLTVVAVVVVVVVVGGRMASHGPKSMCNTRTALGFDTKTDRWGAVPPNTRIRFTAFAGHS